MRALKLIAIAIIGIPAVLVAGIYLRNKAVGPVGWAEDAAMNALRARMKDPDSIVIRSSFIVRKPNRNNGEDIAVCGIVDGKNSFGGFTGGARFVSVSTTLKVGNSETFDTRTIQIEDSSEKTEAASVGMLSSFEQVYWNDSCVDPAHPALTPKDS